MPIPQPRRNEAEKSFIPRCISTLRKTEPDMPPDKVTAICYSTWRKSKGMQRQEYDFKDGMLVPKEMVSV